MCNLQVEGTAEEALRCSAVLAAAFAAVSKQCTVEALLTANSVSLALQLLPESLRVLSSNSSWQLVSFSFHLHLYHQSDAFRAQKGVLMQYIKLKPLHRLSDWTLEALHVRKHYCSIGEKQLRLKNYCLVNSPSKSTFGVYRFGRMLQAYLLTQSSAQGKATLDITKARGRCWNLFVYAGGSENSGDACKIAQLCPEWDCWQMLVPLESCYSWETEVCPLHARALSRWHCMRFACLSHLLYYVQ